MCYNSENILILLWNNAMRLTSLLRSGLSLILLTLNFVLPLLTDMTPAGLEPDVRRMLLLNHYGQITALALVWLTGPSGRLTDLYLGLTAVSILAVGLLGQITAFTMTLGWCLTAMVAADAASRLTRWVRDRRAAAAAAKVMMKELQRDRSLATLKLLIGLTALIDGVIMVTYCLRPGFEESLSSALLLTLTAGGLTAYPVLLMIAGGRRPELTCLAGLAAMTALWSDLWLTLSLRSLDWAGFLRVMESFKFHIGLSRLLAQAGLIIALGAIAARRIEEVSARKKAPRVKPQPAPAFRPLRLFLAIIPLSAGLAAILPAAEAYLGPDSRRPPPWVGAAVTRGLGHIALEVPADLAPPRAAFFSVSRGEDEIRLAEVCGPDDDRPFDPRPPDDGQRRTLLNSDRSGVFGRPARLMAQLDLNHGQEADPESSRRLTLTLFLAFDGGLATLERQHLLPSGARSRKREEIERHTGDFLKAAEEFLAAYHWTGPDIDSRSEEFDTLCGAIAGGGYLVTGQASYHGGDKNLLTLGYGGWFDDSVPSSPILDLELESLYFIGRTRNSYRLREAAGRPGIEQTALDRDQGWPGHSRLTLTWLPDDARSFPLSLRLTAFIDDRRPEDRLEARSRWEALLDSLRLMNEDGPAAAPGPPEDL